VRTRGRQAEALQAIGRRIVTGVYPPGEPLVLDVIALEIGVSRPLLREALSVLSAVGMVRAWPKRGTFVQPRNHWNWLHPLVLGWYNETHSDVQFLDAVAQTREIIEPKVARIAAESRSEANLKELEDSLHEMASCNDDVEAFIAGDLRFHKILLSATNNELLLQLAGVIEVALRSHDHMVYARRWVESLEVHRAVFEAVRQGSGDAAENAMWAVLSQARRDLANIGYGRSHSSAPVGPHKAG
jgi:GntR family galactonate operon transcriptional repressor